MARRQRVTVREAAETARQALLQNAKDLDAKADDRLGDLLLYDLTPGFRAKAAKVRRAFEDEGINPAHALPEPADWPVAFGRALEIVGARIRDKDFRLMDAHKGKNGERRVGVIAVERNGVVTTEHQATVACPKASEGKKAIDAGHPEDAKPYVEPGGENRARAIARDILAVAEELHEVYTTDDIRTAVVQFVDRWYGLPLRRQPPYVAYWVPAAGGEAIRQLRKAIEGLGAGEVELITSYKSDPESRRAIVNSVNKGLEAQLNEFKSEVRHYVDKPADSTRASTIENLIEEANRLREQGALYREILGTAIESVSSDYKKIGATLKKHLGIVEDAAEA